MKENKKLLIIEKCNSNLDTNIEDNGSVILEGTFTSFGIRNRNNRIYEANDVLPFIEKLQAKVQSSTLLGELDHPESYEVSLTKASHVIEKLEYDKATNSIIGRVRLLNTTSGKEAQALVRDGIPLHISSRAAGTVDASGRVKLQEMFTYDLVADPGFANAKLTRVNESYGFGDCDDIAIYDMGYGEANCEQVPAVTDATPVVTDATPAATPLIPDTTSNNNEMAEYSKYLVGIISDLKKEIECLKAQVAQTVAKASEPMSIEPCCSYTDSEIATLEHKLNSLCDYVDELNNESNENTSLGNNNLAGIKNDIKGIKEQIAKMIEFSEYIAENTNNTQKYADYLGKNLDKSIKFSEYIAENVDKTQKYADYLGENLDKSIKFSEYIAENVNNTQKYADYLGENLDKNIKFSEYIAENVDKTQKYADYLGENLNKSIKFSEYIAENVDKTQKYADYLGENLDKSIAYSNYIGEQVDKTQKYGSYLAEQVDKTQQYADYIGKSINENNDKWSKKADMLAKYSEHIAESVNSLISGHDSINESLQKVENFVENTKRGIYAQPAQQAQPAQPVQAPKPVSEAEKKIEYAKSILESRKSATVSTSDLLASINKFTQSVDTLNEAQQKIEAEKKAMEEQMLNESYEKAGVNYLINNIPAELKESWNALSKSAQDAILESAKCYELKSAQQIKHFWYTRNLNEGFVQVEAPVINVNQIQGANSSIDMTSFIRKRLGLC